MLKMIVWIVEFQIIFIFLMLYLYSVNFSITMHNITFLLEKYIKSLLEQLYMYVHT